MISLNIDNIRVRTVSGDTILMVLKRFEIDIPNLCSEIFSKKEYHYCRLCMVKVRKKDETDFSFKLACETQVEDEMYIIANEDKDIIKYRKSILISLLHTHCLSCSLCDVKVSCKLKKYFDDYNVKLATFDANDSLNVTKKIENLPDMLDANYERCIDCDLCVDYQSVAIRRFHTMIMDVCPTNVFMPKYFYSILNDKNTTRMEDSYCIYCSSICECKYLIDDKNILAIFSRDITKNYGICDIGREMPHLTKNNALEHILKLGSYETPVSAKRFYKEFFLLFKEYEALASLSTFYSTDDIKECYDECQRLGIKMISYRTPKISTSIITKCENIGNYKALEILNLESSDIFEYDNIPKTTKLFFIVSDYFLESDEKFIEFCKEYRGKYIIFTPYNGIAAYNAYLAFPISLFGEFSGDYIDKYGNKKTVISYFSQVKDRMNIKKILEYLYS